MNNSSRQPLVSVITPVYNEAECLAECIESVLAQTYQNWDYTIVDNCSSDGSLEIAQRYAARDARIRVQANREFLRAIPNHNRALRQISAASKYCKVVFGDDWLFPECLERMVAVAEEHPSVGIVGAYGLQGGEVMWTGLPYPSRVVCGREICRRLFLEGLYVFGSATSVLYRADLVRSHDPFYNEANLHSDSETCLVILKTCDFGFVNQILTFSREQRPESMRTYSEALNTYSAGWLHGLVMHGPEFLSTEEFALCLKRLLREYYRNLAGGLVRGWGGKYLDYHKRALAEAGVGFSRARLAGAMLAGMCNAILNPKHTIERLVELRSEPPRATPERLRGAETSV
jgi:glycosyltransferase involved in cell wall biosynthesis